MSDFTKHLEGGGSANSSSQIKELGREDITKNKK